MIYQIIIYKISYIVLIILICQLKNLQNTTYCKIFNKFIKFVLQLFVYCDSKILSWNLKW